MLRKPDAAKKGRGDAGACSEQTSVPKDMQSARPRLDCRVSAGALQTRSSARVRAKRRCFSGHDGMASILRGNGPAIT